MNWRHAILLFVMVAVVAVVFAVPAIPQDEAYHDFADSRTLLGVPNCLNVESNFLFLIVGILGIRYVLRTRPDDRSTFHDPVERLAYALFFFSVAITTFGSAYYHLRPDDNRLVWDRLPMAVGFLSLVAAVVCERTTPRNGLRYLVALPLLGVATVLYWNHTQVQGVGDLRPYAIAQFGSLLAVVLLVALFPPHYTRGVDLVVSLLIYGLAKLFEAGDRLIFSKGEFVSGHTLKHITAAVSAYWILRMLKLRKPLAS